MISPHNPCQQGSKSSPWSGMTPTSASLTPKIFQHWIFFCSVKLASLRLKAKSPEMIKWVAMAVPLCEVLLALLYNHLYYQIKYKMTAHNKVVTADIVSWPLPIITLDVFKRITDNSYSMFCFAIFWCESSSFRSHYTRLFSQSYTCIETLTITRVVQPVRHIFKGRENLAASENFLSACSVWSGVFLVLVFLFLGVISILCRLRHREVCEKSGGGGPMMTKSHPWHSPSHSRHPTHSSNPPDLHTPLLQHQIGIG